jgi:hypothetical protein
MTSLGIGSIGHSFHETGSEATLCTQDGNHLTTSLDAYSRSGTLTETVALSDHGG